MKSKIQLRYVLARDKFRKKHGKFDIKNIGEGANHELVEDMLKLAYHFGEWRSQHRRNLKSRSYQTTYRIKNREKVRTYQRDYKRKIRGHKTTMYTYRLS